MIEKKIMILAFLFLAKSVSMIEAKTEYIEGCNIYHDSIKTISESG